MSIYASIGDVGCDDRDQHDQTVLTYKGSHLYPRRGTHKVAHVGLCAIPPWCVPGQEGADEGPDGEWLRLTLATWHDDWGRPMIADGATVAISREAARDLAQQLLEWAGGEAAGDGDD